MGRFRSEERTERPDGAISDSPIRLLRPFVQIHKSAEQKLRSGRVTRISQFIKLKLFLLRRLLYALDHPQIPGAVYKQGEAHRHKADGNRCR